MVDNREEYLTVSELAERIRYSPQTLYNMISAGKFLKGEHYVKPSRRKILFRWSAIRSWLGEQGGAPVGDATDGPTAPGGAAPENRIRI